MYKLLVKSLLLLLIFSSCSKIIDIDIPDKEKHIDIIGVMNTDSIINVNVSKSVNILTKSNRVDFVDDATVKIYEDSVYKETLTFKDNGNYYANFKPVAGNNYKIEVSVPNSGQVDAENIIPDKVDIESIDTLTVYDPFFEENMLRCKIKFTDPSDINNYYYFNIVRKATYTWYDKYQDSLIVKVDSGKVSFQTNDPLIDNGANNGVIFNDNVINGQTYTFIVDLNKDFPDSTTFNFNLCSISKDYYLYLQSWSKQMETHGDPFSEAVPVYTNINNGVGIFAGTNKSTYSILARNPD